MSAWPALCGQDGYVAHVDLLPSFKRFSPFNGHITAMALQLARLGLSGWATGSWKSIPNEKAQILANYEVGELVTSKVSDEAIAWREPRRTWRPSLLCGV